MSGTSYNLRGPNNQPPTILDNLRAAERRVAELEAELVSVRAVLAAGQRDTEGLQHDLAIERANGESLHRALETLQ
ncbi:hypothetical protein AAVH_42846, partial [Aphelenchoides avenae]